MFRHSAEPGAERCPFIRFQEPPISPGPACRGAGDPGLPRKKTAPRACMRIAMLWLAIKCVVLGLNAHGIRAHVAMAEFVLPASVEQAYHYLTSTRHLETLLEAQSNQVTATPPWEQDLARGPSVQELDSCSPAQLLILLCCCTSYAHRCSQSTARLQHDYTGLVWQLHNRSFEEADRHPRQVCRVFRLPGDR